MQQLSMGGFASLCANRCGQLRQGGCNWFSPDHIPCRRVLAMTAPSLRSLGASLPPGQVPSEQPTLEGWPRRLCRARTRGTSVRCCHRRYGIRRGSWTGRRAPPAMPRHSPLRITFVQSSLGLLVEPDDFWKLHGGHYAPKVVGSGDGGWGGRGQGGQPRDHLQFQVHLSQPSLL